MPADMYPDGTDFMVAHPDAGISGDTVATDAEGEEQFQDNLFQFLDIFPHAEVIFSEVYNGVAHQLPRAVIGGAAAPVGAKDGNATFGQYLRRRYDVFIPPEPPDGKHRRVLQEQQTVWNDALGPRLHQCFLPL